jgi:hypothetical protein
LLSNGLDKMALTKIIITTTYPNKNGYESKVITLLYPLSFR